VRGFNDEEDEFELFPSSSVDGFKDTNTTRLFSLLLLIISLLILKFIYRQDCGKDDDDETNSSLSLSLCVKVVRSTRSHFGRFHSPTLPRA